MSPIPTLDTPTARRGRKKRAAEDEATIAAAEKQASMKLAQAEVEKPGSSGLPLQPPNPDKNAERVRLRAEADAAIAGEPSEHDKRMAEIAGKDLEAAAAETARTLTPPVGMPRAEGEILSALPRDVQRSARAITSPTGNTPRGAYSALMGSASRNTQYALGVAGGGFGPDPGAAGRAAGERARGVRPGDVPVIGRDLSKGPQAPAPKMSDFSGMKPVEGGNLITAKVTDVLSAEKAAEAETSAKKFDTRAVEATARATDARAAAAAATTAGDAAKAQQFHDMADKFQAEADTHEATAKSARETAKPQPAGTRTVKRLAKEQGVSDTAARRMMESGDWEGKQFKAIKSIATGRAAFADRGQETSALMAEVNGYGKVAQQMAAYGMDMVRKGKWTEEQLADHLGRIRDSAAKQGNAKAIADKAARDEREAGVNVRHQQDIAAANQRQDKTLAANAAKPVKPDIVYIGDVPYAMVPDGQGGYGPKEIKAPIAGSIGVYGDVTGQSAPTTPALAPGGQPLGVPGAWRGTAPIAAPAAPSAPAAPTAPAVAGKPLDAATAQRLLNEAGGDKEKARAAALALGYSF
jgi:hypothetical protein